MPPLAAFTIWQRYFFQLFKDSSPIAIQICYTVITQADVVRQSDAVEISADNPTACL